jgi:orotate phosphoribosyltransferase
VTGPRIFDPVARQTERDRLLRIVAGSMSDVPMTRADGKSVTGYVQGHRVLGDPEGLRLAATLVLDVIDQTTASVVAGEISAACALVSGIVALSGGTPRPLLGRYLRKELKAYGLPGWLNAELPPSREVFLVDDVSATGACGARCVEVLRSLGHNVTSMMVLVDRDQGAAQRLARLGVDLWALYTLDEVRSARTPAWPTAASG